MNTIRQLAGYVGMWIRLVVGCGVCLLVALICTAIVAVTCAFDCRPASHSTSHAASTLVNSIIFGLCYGALVAFGGMALRPHWVGLQRYLWRWISTSLVVLLVVHTAHVLIETQEFQSIVRTPRWVAVSTVDTLVGAVSGLIGYRGAADKEKHGTSALNWAMAAAAAWWLVFSLFILLAVLLLAQP